VSRSFKKIIFLGYKTPTPFGWMKKRALVKRGFRSDKSYRNEDEDYMVGTRFNPAQEWKLHRDPHFIVGNWKDYNRWARKGFLQWCSRLGYTYCGGKARAGIELEMSFQASGEVVWNYRSWSDASAGQPQSLHQVLVQNCKTVPAQSFPCNLDTRKIQPSSLDPALPVLTQTR